MHPADEECEQEEPEVENPVIPPSLLLHSGVGPMSPSSSPGPGGQPPASSTNGYLSTTTRRAPTMSLSATRSQYTPGAGRPANSSLHVTPDSREALTALARPWMSIS